MEMYNLIKYFITCKHHTSASAFNIDYRNVTQLLDKVLYCHRFDSKLFIFSYVNFIREKQYVITTKVQYEPRARTKNK